ncbi:MAG: hypothetical protein PHU25_01385 [Deltaproteobacteria bacterium]|nr:hypothetical protein [Deltaproteobacteria bacterium]
MSEEIREPERDVPRSPFADILAGMSARIPGAVAAVFFDVEGEAIDYHSFFDPFRTRLVAAHCVVLFESARQRLQWMGCGELARLDSIGATHETVTVQVGGGYYLTVFMTAGGAGDDLETALEEAVVRLRMETGI